MKFKLGKARYKDAVTPAEVHKVDSDSPYGAADCRGFQKDYEKVNFQRIAKDKEGMQKDA